MENLNPANAMPVNTVIDFIMGNKNMSTETIFLKWQACQGEGSTENVPTKEMVKQTKNHHHQKKPKHQSQTFKLYSIKLIIQT